MIVNQTGAVSDNGWPVSDSSNAIDIVPFIVGGVSFLSGVRSGAVYDALFYVANAVHYRVERAMVTQGCYGYSYRKNVNNPDVWSNHASGTAIDFNASLHPNGEPTVENWTNEQIDAIHRILAEVDNKVRWGGDYNDTPDSMHFEIAFGPGDDVTIPPSTDNTFISLPYSIKSKFITSDSYITPISGGLTHDPPTSKGAQATAQNPYDGSGGSQDA